VSVGSLIRAVDGELVPADVQLLVYGVGVCLQAGNAILEWVVVASRITGDPFNASDSSAAPSVPSTQAASNVIGSPTGRVT
jgi:hypothetical protein